MCTPLRARWTAKRTWLVGLWVHILWKRRTGLVGQSIGWLTLEQCQTCLDVHIGRIEVRGACVRVKRIACLIVARLVLYLCQQ